MAGVWGRIKQFDAYPKTLEDFRVKTFTGASSKWLDLLPGSILATYPPFPAQSLWSAGVLSSYSSSQSSSTICRLT